MGYITFDYRCIECQTIETQMLDRTEIVDTIPCGDCGGSMVKMLTANITRVSYPDGTTDRFKYVHEKRKLDKLARIARKKGDMDSLQRIKAERNEVKQVSKTDRQAVNINKVSVKE